MEPLHEAPHEGVHRRRRITSGTLLLSDAFANFSVDCVPRPAPLVACKDPETAAVQAKPSPTRPGSPRVEPSWPPTSPGVPPRPSAPPPTARENPEPLLLMAEAHRAAATTPRPSWPSRRPRPRPRERSRHREADGGPLPRRGPRRRGHHRPRGAAGSREPRRQGAAHAGADAGPAAAIPRAPSRRWSPSRRKNPDDADAKVVEAEILLIKGDEILAAKLMDRLSRSTRS